WILDSAASCHVTNMITHMTNYKPCVGNERVVTASQNSFCIAGHGDLIILFPSRDNKEVEILLQNVAHVPDLGFNLFSCQAAADKVLNFTRDPGCHYTLHGQRILPRLNRNAELALKATIAPSLAPHAPHTNVDINLFHRSYGHAHEALLKSTATSMGITLVGELEPCAGCSMSKGIRKGVRSSTSTRAVRKLDRVFVDLSGKRATLSIGGKQYTMIIRDDYSRFVWLYFLRAKSDAAEAFKKYLADIRADGTPSRVMCVRSDNGGEFYEGAFGALCRDRGIRQEFTPADSPQFNGVAERMLGIIDEASLAARLQAPLLFPHVTIPKTDSLWAEAQHYVCDSLNRTSTTANPGCKSPYEMWY
ncbi:unnamed protein product, partial [Ectocarpus sp. 12 AP-2014]